MEDNTLDSPPKKELIKNEEGTVIQCIVCNAILGQESRDMDYIVCHEHRKCTKCNSTVKPVEAYWSYNNDYPIAHASCLTLKMQKENVPVSLVNVCCNLLSVDMDLSVESNQKQGEVEINQLVAYMDMDRLYMLMRKMQAEAAALSFILSKDRTKIEKQIGEREKKKFAAVQEDRIKKTHTKSDKKADAKHGIEGLTPQEKAIKLLMKNLPHLSREECEKVYADAHARKQ